MSATRPEKVISGAQTGADRGGLDFAIKHGIPHGGWCPPFRKAEDGTIPEQYQVREVPESLFRDVGMKYTDVKDGYRLRTKLNVQQGDGTLIVVYDRDNLSPGCRLTRGYVTELEKPCLVVSPRDDDAAWRVEMFVKDQGIKVLNVAGTRESKAPGLQEATTAMLEAAFGLSG